MSQTEEVDQVFDAWRVSAELHEFGNPIDEAGLLAAEARLGRPLPDALSRLYAFTDGFDGFHGSIHMERALRTADLADDLRDNDWDIGPELLVFGGNGSDERWALWYPDGAAPNDATPVVEIGEISKVEASR
jgi:hypothetical protein